MKLKNFAVSLVSIAISASAFIGCSRNNNNNNQGLNPFNQFGTLGQFGCVAPNFLDQAGRCIGPNGQVVTTGNGTIRFYSQVSQGIMSITNPGAYSNFLKNGMATCDRFSADNSGIYKCANWTGGDLVIEMVPTSNAGNQYLVRLQAGPGFTGGSNFYTGIETGLPLRNPLEMQAVVSVINNNQGFELRQNVNQGLFQLQVMNGKIENSQIQFQLAWGDRQNPTSQVFATGTLYRY